MAWRLQENLQVVNRDFEPYRIDGKNKYKWVETRVGAKGIEGGQSPP